MFYMLKPNILFRKYGDLGYVTDNALFGYRVHGDEKLYPGERYVSDSGAVMLQILNKKPKNIDKVVGELRDVYTNVAYDTLKQDSIEFYDSLVRTDSCHAGTLLRNAL